MAKKKPKKQKAAANKAKQSTAKKSSQATSSNKSLYRILGIIAAVVGFLVYANTLGHEYALDDSSVFEDNYVVQKGEFDNIWTKHYRYGFWKGAPAIYRPIPLTFFALQWMMVPNSPQTYHLINVLLFALTGFVLFVTLRRLFKDYNVLLPFLATILFMVHPIHCEVVANIKSQDEILAFLGCISALYFLLRNAADGKIQWLIGSVAAFTFAFFCKENTITFLAIFPLALYFFTKVDIPNIAKKTVIYLVPTILFLYIRHEIVGGFGNENTKGLDNFLVDITDTSSRLASTFMMMGKYLVTLVFPHPLSHEFGYNQIPAVSFASWQALLSLLAYVGLGVLAIVGLKKKTVYSFAILFYLATFSIYANLFVKIGSSYGDRFLYFPSLGFAIGLAWVLMKIFKTDFAKSKVADLASFGKNYSMVLAVGGVIGLAYAAKTVLRNPAWENSYTLYSTDIQTVPNSAKLRYHNGLETGKMGNRKIEEGQRKVQKGEVDQGNLLRQEGLQMQQEAITNFERALELYPSYSDPHGQMGLAYYRQGNQAKAMEHYQKAIELEPSDENSYSNMGIIYFNKKQYGQAINVYKKALEINPRFTDARQNLGACFAMTGNFDGAIEQFLKGLDVATTTQQKITINGYLSMAYRDKGDAVNSKKHSDLVKQLQSN